VPENLGAIFDTHCIVRRYGVVSYSMTRRDLINKQFIYSLVTV